MRAIKKIIVHCTATPEGRPVSVADVDRWHRQRGFDGIGYHYLVGLGGEVWPGRPEEKVGAHCKGHNADSIGVCYVGGCNERMEPCDTRTFGQKVALRRLLRDLRRRYPRAGIHSHSEFATKACPSFDAREEYADL